MRSQYPHQGQKASVNFLLHARDRLKFAETSPSFLMMNDGF